MRQSCTDAMKMKPISIGIDCATVGSNLLIHMNFSLAVNH